ncbi:hypothetical protein LJC14_01480 [Treponema sp. OttesenSCG-928-L16]|nr:hypothetical protein [Treponema sp. OttesenSCG-928-L16]
MRQITILFLLFFSILLFPCRRAEAENRAGPIDAYLIIDASSSILTVKDEALQWVCSSFVDGQLQQGDRLTVWTVSDTSRIIFSDVLSGPEQIEKLKALLKGIQPGNGAASYAGVFREIIRRDSARSGAPFSYTLFISGSSPQGAAGAAELAELLRYSRVENFPGWRAFIVGSNIGSRAQAAAAAYVRAGR